MERKLIKCIFADTLVSLQPGREIYIHIIFPCSVSRPDRDS